MVKLKQTSDEEKIGFDVAPTEVHENYFYPIIVGLGESSYDIPC